jgi:uncharacterized protein YprB with RNaseH-like and TPR domain
MAGNDAHQRLTRLAHLRKLGVRRGARDLSRPPVPRSAAESCALPGEAIETPFGPVWVRTVRCPLSEQPGLAELLNVEPAAWAALGQDPALETLDPTSAAFIDTETTGLSIGTGTYTFLIGIGTYEAPQPPVPPGGGNAGPGQLAGGHFVVQQFFMRNPAEERAQLHLVEEALGRCTGIISFNGRAFDLPLVQNRFILARVPPPLAGAPHLDLLPPARRLWRGRLDSCRLGSLEQQVLGVRRTEEDVPGWLIPEIYRDYYRTGVANEILARVFYHNLVDITSMVLLAARMARHFRPSEPARYLRDLPPLDCISLARCYEALHWPEAGEAAYRAALAGPLGDSERARIVRDLGFLLKRQERLDEAAALWEEWISSIPGDDPTPYIELAKYHEWRTGDLVAARGWAAWALRIVENWPPGPPRDIALAELCHRLARLERKTVAG